MTATTRTSLACLIGALLSGIPMVALAQDRSFLLLAAALCGISFGAGVMLRRSGRSGLSVRLPQLAAVLIIPLLTPQVLTPLLWQQTIALLRNSYAPVPYDTGFAVLSALLIWLVYLLVESLSIGLASPAWTFPALLLPYLLPCAVIFEEVEPTLLIGPAVGYVVILGAATIGEAGLSGARAPALAATAIATTAALLGGFILALPMSMVDGRPGEGGTIHLSDPNLDLIRTLRRNSSQVLIRYRTSDGAGDYLRLTALPVLDREGFHPASSELVRLPSWNHPPAAATDLVESNIEVGGFTSQYLPLPWFPISTDVPSADWKLQPGSQTILTDNSSGTKDLSYQVTSARLPAEVSLASLRAGRPDDAEQTLALPAELPPGVAQLATELTDDEPTAGAKAQAIADYLRSSEFTYSTAGAAGTPMGTMQDFLFESRTGYCVQFAAAMAILAREVDIPSRVVIGFLPGKAVGDHWEVTGQNMHAWTELYFADVGWYRIDATPSANLADPPSASPSQSASPSATPSSASPSASAPTTTPDQPTQAPNPVGGAIPVWPWWALAGLVLLVASPGLVRSLQRRRRLAGASDPTRAAELAWSEIRATTIDLGQPWPTGTPSQVAAELGAELTGTGRLALIGLAQDLDQVHFDREPNRPAELHERAQLVILSLERRWPSKPWQRIWPRSLRGPLAPK